MSLRHIVLMAAALALAAPAARAQSPDSLLHRAAAAWSHVNTLRAEFRQTLTNPLTGSTAHATGVFQKARPGKLSIVFAGEGDRIVDDGRYVWIYLPSAAPGQVIRRPADRANGAVPLDLAAQFLDQAARRFTVTPAGKGDVDGLTATVLSLVPKPGTNAPFTRARIWITDRDAFIRQFETHEESGVTRRVRLTSLAVNAPVDAAAFQFRPPAGVRVVTPD